MTITFKVSDVKETSVEGEKEFNHSLLKESPKDADKKVVKTSITENSKSIRGDNSFVYSAVLAYSKHHNLEIRPDDIWMAILVQFSLYVNANSEQLREKIVDFQGKKQLTVHGNGTLMTAPYEEMTIKMTHEIEKNIKDPSIREWVTGKFSTSTPKDTICSSIALMCTLKSYFSFKMSLMCGLPSVTLHGTTEDWLDIKSRVNKLKEFDFKGNNDLMKQWVDLLEPVIDKFIATSQGNPDTQWYNQIANYIGGGSGPTYLSGWITVFCVFDNDGKWKADNKTYTPMFRGETETTDWLFIDSNDIPKGYLSCPVLIDDNGTEYNTEFYAGHMAIELSTPKTIKPSIDWCILV